jgi:YegS/Rv2252/BmrU family lipid kinase
LRSAAGKAAARAPGERAALLIVNPRAAGGRVARRWSAIEAMLRKSLPDFEVRHTEAPGHATALCREAISRGVREVLVFGGDGTLSEAVSGYFRDGVAVDAEASIGLLPCGTGGDFRRTLDLPNDVQEAARRLAKAQVRRIDAGRLRYTRDDGTRAERYFCNIASFGIGGLVDRIVNRSKKALPGRAAFLMGTLRALAQYKNRRVRVALDGGTPLDLVINNVAVCNGRYFGGGMKVAPDALLDDGRFDVVAIGDVGIREVLAQGRHLYRGTHVSLPKVQVWRAARVDAEPTGREEVLLDVDGEQPGRLPASFEILPRALGFRC